MRAARCQDDLACKGEKCSVVDVSCWSLHIATKENVEHS
jgi:hypothetical protein